MFFFLFCKKKPLIKGFDTKNLPMPYYPEYSVRFFKKIFLGIHLFGEYGNPEWGKFKIICSIYFELSRTYYYRFL